MAKRIPKNQNRQRVRVMKTYKMYIGGAFPRTESGRYYSPVSKRGALGNLCLASRKDLRNAVVTARAAQAGWCGRSAYNRGQILYRIAEMLEDRRDQFFAELIRQDLDERQADLEVQSSIDRCVVYAGWADKYQQIFSCVNPVASSHFNFSVLEPTGVVFVFASESSPLLGLVSLLAPIIVGGNSCVILASKSRPLSAVSFAEVLNSSDVPGGVVNILTGDPAELSEHVGRHMDINAVAYNRDNAEILGLIKRAAADNVKRIGTHENDWMEPSAANPYLIEQYSELKTTWHPVEKIGPTGSGY